MPPPPDRAEPPPSASTISTSRPGTEQNGTAAHTTGRDIARRLRSLGHTTQLIATRHATFLLRAVNHLAHGCGITRDLRVDAVGIQPTAVGATTERLGSAGQLSASPEQGVLIVKVSGMVEEREHAPLRDRLNALTGASSGNVVLDLRGVEFLVPAGLGVVLGLRVRLKEAGRTLHLLGGEPVHQLLRITGFTTVPLHDDLAQALAAAQGKRWRR
ncbi:STAS domain-containing protein [Streptomyces albipurpureus]|uniref:STAS domain-containing protein n=1 Tax=Streptomyces albipurpureus TaxID=2897419 RepID=A0ABT0UXN4_9ACTN|nr:STAS domain-containing protein [Streptomyces sp. CWNU-1]MCM2392724.1 STAS domain-containing protein [Streptomyces sp. CWNU-1]